MTTTTTRAPRRDATENRIALLDAARVELNLDPVASLEAIALRAGLSRRAVYGHFATRDDLVRELVTLGAARIASALAGVDHPDPVVRIALIASHLWREVEDIRVMAVVAVRGPLARHTAEGLAPVRARVRSAVTEGAAAGSVRSDIPADSLARLVEDSVLGGLAEATRSDLPGATAHRLVMLIALSVLGLGSADAAALIDATPELEWTERA